MSLLSNANAIGGGYTIPNSLRFRASGSAYLSKTWGTAATDGKKMTFSAWVKRGNLSTQNTIYASLNNYESCIFQTDGTIRLNGPYMAAQQGILVTTQVFRDPSAHLHIVVVYDTANATAGDRVQLWINGTRVTSFSTNTASNINNTCTEWLVNTKVNQIGYLSPYPFDGLMSEVVVVDGQALTPSSFGEQNSDGVWVPKKYTGTYGNNGFYLPFSDNSGLTSGSNTGLGKDFSGNGNYWNTNAISLTAGVTYDSMVDTQTNNYAVLNPIDIGGTPTITDGNLKNASATAAFRGTRGTIAVPSSGKWYWEYINTTLTASGVANEYGVATSAAALNTVEVAGHYALYASSVGEVTNNGSNTGGFGTIGAGVVVQVAADCDNGRIWFGKDNVWFNSSAGTTGDPTNNANPTLSVSPAGMFPVTVAYNNSSNANFGQRPFSYTPPTGFKALCTANRPSGGSITTSGTFTGNASTDGPVVWLNGNPETMAINGNAVTWGTHADKLAGGFKVRSSSASYNASGSNTYSVTVTGKLFGDIAHAPNTAKGNP